MKTHLTTNRLGLASLSPLNIQTLEEFTKAVSALLQNRLKTVILYGSQARGDALSDSDIDILLVIDSSENINLDWDQCINIAAEIASQTGVLISVMLCHAKDYAEREHPLLMNIRREGIMVA